MPTCNHCSAPLTPRVGSGGPAKRFCNRSCAASFAQRKPDGTNEVIDALRAVLGLAPLYAAEPRTGANWMPTFPRRERVGRMVT